MTDLIKVKREYQAKLDIFKDPSFIFNESEHSYHFEGVRYDSVTTFLKKFKVPFDRDFWAGKKAQEYGVDVSEVKKDWQSKADVANDLGTRVHKWIEDFWTGLNPPLPEEEDLKERVEKFLALHEERFKDLVPLQPELKVFSKKWRIAGTVDQPFLMWDKKQNKLLFLIGDWKTNKEFKDDKHPKGKYKKLLHPFADLYENSHNEYSIQISLYRLIIEEETGLKTDGGFLCHIGPQEKPKIYPVKDLRERLKIYLQHNREEFDIFNV